MIPGARVVLAFLCAVGIDAFGDGVSVNAERFGRMGNPLFIARECFLNVELLKLGQRLIKCDVAVEHIFNYSF